MCYLLTSTTLPYLLIITYCVFTCLLPTSSSHNPQTPQATYLTLSLPASRITVCTVCIYYRLLVLPFTSTSRGLLLLPLPLLHTSSTRSKQPDQTPS
ncbi:hypothetical protein F5B20DRAFT_162810 [Whalleya microplaca]|nr:hypothetical protein F5B20DRAFT_162810 [Whalleya microplaca]